MSFKGEYIEIFENFRNDGNFQRFVKILVKGSFGEVRYIIYKNKSATGKIVKMTKDEKFGEQYAADLKGQNIIKINKIISKEINSQLWKKQY